MSDQPLPAIDMGKLGTHKGADEALQVLESLGVEIPAEIRAAKVADKAAFIKQHVEAQAPSEPQNDAPASDTEPSVPDVDDAVQSAPAAEDDAPEAPAADTPIKFYRGEPVIEVRNVILNGRQYVDVFTNGASYRLTTAEFDAIIHE